MGRPLIDDPEVPGWLDRQLSVLDLMRAFLIEVGKAHLPQPYNVSRNNAFCFKWFYGDDQNKDVVVHFRKRHGIAEIEIDPEGEDEQYILSELNAAIAALKRIIC